MKDPFKAELKIWSQLQPTVTRTVFALHLAEAVLPPFDTLRTVLDMWCCSPPPPPATEAEIAARKEIAELFNTFDKDKSGFVTIDDFQVITMVIGDTFSDSLPSVFDWWNKMVDEMLAEANVQSDGRIKYIEFVKKMMSM